MLNKLWAIFWDKELRKRIIFTLFILFCFRFGASLTIPGVTIQQNINNNSIFAIMNMLGGGALSQFSLFALGVSPYITASIIVQLLSMDIIPSWSELTRSGEQGRRQLNRITKWMALVLAIVQSFGLTYVMSQQQIIRIDNQFASYLFIMVLLIAGATLTVWLGDQISDKGIGNGLSIIIFAGIVANMPYQIYQTFQMFVAGDNPQALFSGMLNFGFFMGAWLGVIAFLVFFEQAERKIPIQYTVAHDIKRKEEISYLPLKINVGGVIPIIFASAVITAPATFASFFPDQEWAWFIQKYFTLENGWGFTAFIMMIFGFTFFQAHATIDGKVISENLMKSSSFIPGIRSGKETEDYIKRVLNRLATMGGLFLVAVAGLPFLTTQLLKVQTPLSLGGSALIIVVGVALETSRQIQGRLFQKSYKGFINTQNELNQAEIEKKLESMEW